MKTILQLTFYMLMVSMIYGQSGKISVVNNAEGNRLLVDGQDFMINGMNWDYFPVGTNFTYSLWNQPDDIIRAALDMEMQLLKNMGVNVIRQYTGVQPKWIQYIYEKYGIYTMLNHSFGRYGLTLDGAWVGNTEYADPRTQKLLIQEVQAMAEEYKDTPGLLLYLLGNENNYGLFWEGAETEDIPIQDRHSTQRAQAMYKLFNDAAIEMKAIDASHPVAMCNGDLLFMDIIIQECQDVDIFGTNMYRGASFGDAFERVRKEFNKPILFTEFGADAFNAIDNQEDQKSQAYYNLANWKEIYENAPGLGLSNNSIGGFTFQFSDGWWKYGQTKNLDVHDNNASWGNGGYAMDYVEGANNMNEEWFGVCAKGATNERGLYQLYPRAAYYALKEAHSINLNAEGTTLQSIQAHFDQISIIEAVMKARGDKAALIGEQSQKIRLSEMSARFTTFSTGGDKVSTPKNAASDPEKVTYPNRQGFDHMQSYFLGVEAKPSESIRVNVNVNVLGKVAENPINEIFYENRGRTRTFVTDQGEVQLSSVDRVKVYQAEFNWNHEHFDLNGFYRTGHYHWGYEGDFFGLYPEANYGPNIDIYNGEAPLGFEFESKKILKGFKIAFGPELWWGANPAILLKYGNKIGRWNVTGLYHEDLDEQSPAVSSFAVPIPPNRRATLHAKTKINKVGIELGAIWSGSTRLNETFQIVTGTEGEYVIKQDVTRGKDTWGGKVKFTYANGPFNWYAQGAAMGLVAMAGADYTRTFTGWKLKDSGSGNQVNFLTGFTIGIGDFQIAPNFLWQKPIIDPMPADVPAPGRPRNILDDPFAVRGNRETVAGEILFTYDPTPGTWMYEWDNDMTEDAKFAISAGFVYRHLPTVQDAAIGIFADGRTTFAFPGSAPAQDLWEVNTRIVSKISQKFGVIANLYGGNAQARGSDPRLIHRYGGDVRMIYKKMKVTTSVKVDDWGPFDYHGDFNLTYPLQLVLDVSTSLGKPSWFNLPNTQVGVMGTWRALDQYSPRYCPTFALDATGASVCDPKAIGYDNGNEWEIRTYLHFNINR